MSTAPINFNFQTAPNGNQITTNGLNLSRPGVGVTNHIDETDFSGLPIIPFSADIDVRTGTSGGLYIVNNGAATDVPNIHIAQDYPLENVFRISNFVSAEVNLGHISGNDVILRGVQRGSIDIPAWSDEDVRIEIDATRHVRDALYDFNIDTAKGDDRLILNSDFTGSHFIVNTNEGNDFVDANLYAQTTANLGDGNDTFYGSNKGDSVIAGNGNDFIAAKGGDDYINAGDGNDRVFGDGGNDTIFGGAGEDRLDGGSGEDTIDGGADRDIVHGNDGDDIIYGAGGDDFISGDADNDTLYGESGNDELLGGTGNDTIFAGNGNDILRGEGGKDTLYGDDGADFLSGGVNNDSLFGGAGNDRMFGDEGNDHMEGDIGNDQMFGGSGDDTIYGGGNGDFITGNEGNDFIDGGTGSDRVYGNEGDDTIVFDHTDTAISGGQGFDILVVNDGAGEIDFTKADSHVFGFNQIREIEGVDLHNSSNDSVYLTAADVLSSSDDPLSGAAELFVKGDTGDNIDTAFGDFSVRGTDVNIHGVDYATFNDSGVTLYVELGMQLNGTAVL
jgi:Ca2+-binding RTX toxin-like protein